MKTETKITGNEEPCMRGGDVTLIGLVILGTTLCVAASHWWPTHHDASKAVVQEALDKANSDPRPQLEIADTATLRAKGLRGHAPLDDMHGMVLKFEKPSVQCIWNSGVSFPVDAGFYGEDGRLFGGVTMKANEDIRVCTKRPVLSIVEMRGGWFKEHLKLK
jgi:uncharacterized membrane protein (UPF0127 family)